jgi:flagellar motor switch protein FliG
MIQRRVDKEFEGFIHQRQPGAVAALLKDEQPQVQAVALSLMGPGNAARILRFMDQHRQAEITMRMSRLKHIPGELADDVMLSIREALGASDDYMEIGGVDKTARILGKMRRKDQQPILGAIEDENGDLADQLRRRMVVFEDLKTLNKRYMQVLLKQVEKDDLLQALKGATPDMQDLFLGNVSKRQAQDLREELEIMGQIQKSRIRIAQENIVAEALKLMEEGMIYLDIGAPDDEEE